jgi:hypothetical protein
MLNGKLATIMRQFQIAILVAFALSVPASAQTVTSQDVDLGCAVGATLEMIKATQGSKLAQRFYELSLFYLGRLSARDERADWGTVIGKAIKGRRGAAAPAALMDECVKRFSRKIHVSPPPQSN